MVRTVEWRDRCRLAGDVRLGRHGRRQRPIQAEHELVGSIVVGQEPRELETIDLIRSGDGIRRRAVQRRCSGAHETQQSRPVTKQVLQ